MARVCHVIYIPDITVFAELWSFRNLHRASALGAAKKVKKFKMLKFLVLLLCLSVTLGEYFLLWLSFM